MPPIEQLRPAEEGLGWYAKTSNSPDPFYQFDTVTLEVVVQDYTAQLTYCATPANCQINYDWSYTPNLYFMTPRVVYNGMYAGMYFNSRKGATYFDQSGDNPRLDLTIDGVSLDLTGVTQSSVTVDENLAQTPLTITDDLDQVIRGYVQNTERVSSAYVNATFYGIGNAVLHPEFSYTCGDWDGIG